MKYEANNLCILSGDELNKITRFHYGIHDVV